MSNSEIILYTTPQGEIKIEVFSSRRNRFGLLSGQWVNCLEW